MRGIAAKRNDVLILIALAAVSETAFVCSTNTFSKVVAGIMLCAFAGGIVKYLKRNRPAASAVVE